MQLDPKLCEALERLYAYLYESEEKNYAENRSPFGHIFRDVLILGRFLDINNPDRVFIESEDDPEELEPTSRWRVCYTDSRGESTLSRQRTKKAADKRAAHFRRDLAAGRLLREDPSVWE
jgi:hypothetical protein